MSVTPRGPMSIRLRCAYLTMDSDWEMAFKEISVQTHSRMLNGCFDNITDICAKKVILFLKLWSSIAQIKFKEIYIF